MVRPQKDKRGKQRSIHVKHNKAYQALLAGLIIIFVLVCAVVITSIGMPTSHVWKDNILIRMIVETHRFIRSK